jgi:DNA-binding NarL/FixJ family response regulator
MRQVGWSRTPGNATEPSGDANPAAVDPVAADRQAAGITVLIADDHGGFRRALEAALRRAPGLELVGSAHDGNEAVLMSVKLRPRVVVMDLAMPGMSGVEATRRLMEEREPPAVVALSGSRELMRDAIAAGASSTLLKDADLSELLDSIRIVAKR